MNRRVSLIALLLLAGCDGTPDGDDGPSPGAPDHGFPTADSGPVFEDVGGAGDPGVAGRCDPGASCDDGDPCTFDDQCVGGVCAGTPVDCDDGVPCTEDACVQGACQHTIAPGSCRIDGACWSADQANPANGCEKCAPGLQTKQWSPNDGFACDDGDPCTDDVCLGGACVGTPKVCEGDDDPCTEAVCVAGTCENRPLDGEPCDDGDPCTTGDRCEEGSCVGEDSGCDDGLACTEDACTTEGCVHTPEPGFCAIDGVCFGNGQTNAEDACQRCDPDEDPLGWTGAPDGTKCDDGDPCTEDDACRAGICTGTPLGCPDDGNPCTKPACGGGSCAVEVLDGAPCDDGDPCTTGTSCQGEVCGGGEVVSEGPECGDSAAIGDPCVYHTDCYPEALCARRLTTGAKVCSAPCAGNADCPGAQICTKLPGAANVAFCQDPAAGLKSIGQSCGDSVECTSNLCADLACAGFCLNEDHCPGAQQTCYPVGDLAAGEVTTACSPNPPGFKAIGEVCTDGASYGGHVCASGHCDIMSLNEASYQCARACLTKADCFGHQECNVIVYGEVPNPDSVRFDPAPVVPPQTFDAFTGCFTPPNGTGAKFDGATCSHPDECQSRKCLPLIPKSEPNSDQAFCTRFCATDADCNSDMVCKTELLNLASAWLQMPTQINGSQDPNLEGWTIVRVCKFP